MFGLAQDTTSFCVLIVSAEGAGTRSWTNWRLEGEVHSDWHVID